MGIKIQETLPLAEVIGRLLKELNDLPDTDYTKQLFIHIHDKALKSQEFTNDMEREIEDYFASAPRLDEIYDCIAEPIDTMEGILDYYGVSEAATKATQAAKKAKKATRK